jgi:uncharacterized protein YndB with AHSA1/START domain
MPDILHKIAARRPVRAFYDALTTVPGLAGWWTVDTEGDPGVGGDLRFRFGELGFFRMRVLETDPAQRVVWEVAEGPADWIGTTLHFDLKESGDHAVLLFRHAGWREPSEGMHHCSTKWAVFLLSLKALVETGKGRPAPDDQKIDDWN